MSIVFTPSLYLGDAASHSGGGSNISLQVTLSLGGIVLGAVCSYIVMRLNARHDPRKQLSWEATTDRSLVSVRPEIRDNVSVLYKTEEASNLVAIKCRIINTGNQVVKNERLRFAFPDGTRIFEADFSPQPEPELKARRVDDSDHAKPTDRVFEIGHIEVAQEVSFELVADGPNADKWAIHPFNEDGDVGFQQRDVNRIRGEQEHVVPFVAISIGLLVVPLVISNLYIGDGITIFISPFMFLIRLALVIALLPHILPVARLIRRLVALQLAKPEPEPATRVTVESGSPYFVASSGNVQRIDFHVPPEEEIETATVPKPSAE
jgi:hypothetical protein